MTATEQVNLSQFLWKLSDWCIAHRSKHVLQGERDKVFRYVAHTYLTGRMAVSTEPETGDILAVVFYWTDRREMIELKAEQKWQQYDWGMQKPGDALFIAEVIGSREGIRRIYTAAIEKFPNVMLVPFFSYRHGKLVELSKKRIEHFLA